MQVGMIGLGHMGSKMVRRLIKQGHQCVVYDHDLDAVKALNNEGAIGKDSLKDFVTCLAVPGVVWLMIPAHKVDEMLLDLIPLLEIGDTVIDGSNSNYQDDIRRAAELEKKDIHFVDVGVSGIVGHERGYRLMIGGEKAVIEPLESLFTSLAADVDLAALNINCNKLRNKIYHSSEKAYLHCGSYGAGHFVKMVQTGIEYA